MPTQDPEAAVRDLFLTAAGRANPYPIYHRLREAAPVHRSTMRTWLLSRYDDCLAALRDPRLIRNYARSMEIQIGSDWRQHPSAVGGEHEMTNVNGAEHARLHRFVERAFNTRTVDALRPSIAATVERPPDRLADAGGGDVLEAVAYP